MARALRVRLMTARHPPRGRPGRAAGAARRARWRRPHRRCRADTLAPLAGPIYGRPTARPSQEVRMPLLRRRPLLRAAAVGGTAYYAGKRRAEAEEREELQEARLSGLEQQQAAAPAAGGLSPDAIERLKALGQLRDQGVLTDDEFERAKAKVLGG